MQEKRWKKLSCALYPGDGNTLKPRHDANCLFHAAHDVA